MMLAAAAVCNSSLETFITDAEDSDDTSRQDDSSAHSLLDFWTCIQCKSQNDNPQFRFCDKCYQDRKTFFPPRPRRNRKARRSKQDTVKLDALQSCLSGLSQESSLSRDSGLGFSQELPSLDLDQIVVPKDTPPSISGSPTSRKRQISESSLSEFEPSPVKPKRVKMEKQKALIFEEDKCKTEVVDKTKESIVGQITNDKLRTSNKHNEKFNVSLPECNEMCIMCNEKPKNSIFLHGKIGHMSCCYKCAKRTWKSLKRCPICNRSVNNVIRVYTT